MTNYKRNRDVSNNMRNGGEEWTDHEKERVLDEDRPSDRELSSELGRSVQAIQARRSILLKDSRPVNLSAKGEKAV